jgi:hypothetical protein
MMPPLRSLHEEASFYRWEELAIMSAVASVSFPCDGSDDEFRSLYDTLCALGLDIAAYLVGRTGVIEFIIGDFESFKDLVAQKSAELGVELIVVDYLRSEVISRISSSGSPTVSDENERVKNHTR